MKAPGDFEPAALRTLLQLDIRIKPVQTLAGVPGGERLVYDILGGRFDGPRLCGRVLASGGDWVLRTPGRSQLDVRLVLQTDDGVSLLLRYGGRASQRDGAPRIEVAGSFEAPEGAYAWLNDIQAFGLGAPLADGVRYRFFCFA